MKSNGLVLLLALTLIAGIFFFLPLHTRDSVSLTVRTISEEEEHISIYAEYPQFSDFPKAFNQRIEDAVLGQIRQFRESVEQVEANRLESWGADMPEYEYTLAVGWSPAQLSPRVASILLRTSYFTGGAHGGHELSTFTFDEEKGEEVFLADVFEGVPNYLERISRFALNDLKSRLEHAGGGEPNMSMLTDGTAPRVENFERFTLQSDGTITFYFPEYQVAPYVFGEQKVVMPLSFLSSAR